MTDINENRLALASRLRAAREQAGLSQGQVAKLLDYKRPTISEIEAGRRKVSAEELPRFADAYGVTAAWIIHESPQDYDPAVELAARELTKLKQEDLDTVLQLLKTVKKSGSTDQ